RLAPAVLTIEAPIPSSRGGGGGGSGSGCTSPLSGYNQSGERGRERPRSAGSDKGCPETTAPDARHRQNRDRSGTGAADGFLRIRATANAPLTSPDEDSPRVFDFGGGHRGARGYQYRRRRRRECEREVFSPTAVTCLVAGSQHDEPSRRKLQHRLVERRQRAHRSGSRRGWRW
ncbi:unnamed protein product, partial [Ectocarpus sp. 4 AP-2014]